MEWFIALLAVVVLGLAAVAAAGGLGGIAPLVSDRAEPVLPDRWLGAEDLAGLRFAVVPRGYAMDQVDQVINRLGAQLQAMSGQPESGIMDTSEVSDRRNHNGSDEASYGRWAD
jgi:DivIVA domain-containing protein